jgi:hypothetical protein
VIAQANPMLTDDDIFNPDEDHLADLDANRISLSKIELERIPVQLWEQTLALVSSPARFLVARRIPDEELRERALELVGEMQEAGWRRKRARDDARSRGRRAAAPLPVPDPEHAATRRSIQINLRLRGDDHARLAAAAAAVGLRPTTLARALVLNGVAKIRSERTDS